MTRGARKKVLDALERVGPDGSLEEKNRAEHAWCPRCRQLLLFLVEQTFGRTLQHCVNVECENNVPHPLTINPDEFTEETK